jgi:SNF2 family DNA or RNA helicase
LLRGDDGRAEDLLAARTWGCVIVDEIHQARNPKGQFHQALCALRCPRKLGLTGTPLQNSLTDVWALLRVVGAHKDYDLSSFESQFSKPIARGQKRKASVKDLAIREDALKDFKELLAGSVLRRTKEEVALSLPGKNDRVVPCPLSDVQRAAYRNLLASPDFQMALGRRQVCVCGAGRPCTCGTGPIWRHVHRRQAELKGLEDEWAAADDCVCRGRSPPKCLSLSLIVMLQRLTNHLELLKPEPQNPKDSEEQHQQALMREVCDLAFAGINHNLCTNRNVANRLLLGSPEACGKMQVLLPLLMHWRRRQRKVLIFSRSTRLLDILEACFWQQGCSPQVLRLDGSTPAAQRQRLVDEFNTSSTRGIFLISTRAGGVGLNLTGASVVVIFDPDWNPFSDLQAQDRSFRIGQTRVVEVYRLLGAGTVEEQVYVRQVWKQQLAASAIDGARSARRLDGDSQGLEKLLEFHDSSLLPALMAEAFRERALCQESSEAGVRIFTDCRGGSPAQLTDFLDQDAIKVATSSLAAAAGAAPAATTATEVSACRAEASQASLEQLHGMFDQLDHSKVVRNDTQENLLLTDLIEDFD